VDENFPSNMLMEKWAPSPRPLPQGERE